MMQIFTFDKFGHKYSCSPIGEWLETVHPDGRVERATPEQWEAAEKRARACPVPAHVMRHLALACKLPHFWQQLGDDSSIGAWAEVPRWCRGGYWLSMPSGRRPWAAWIELREVVAYRVAKASSWFDSQAAWRRVRRVFCRDGHFFAGEFPLGWKELVVDWREVEILSPYKLVRWPGRELWADKYNPQGPALNEPGIHAWAFWSIPAENEDVNAFALVAPLGHATLGDNSWRAEGAALLRVWVNAPPSVAQGASEKYGVPCRRASSPKLSAYSWAARCLEKGEPLAPELDELAF